MTTPADTAPPQRHSTKTPGLLVAVPSDAGDPRNQSAEVDSSVLGSNSSGSAKVDSENDNDGGGNVLLADSNTAATAGSATATATTVETKDPYFSNKNGRAWLQKFRRLKELYSRGETNTKNYPIDLKNWLSTSCTRLFRLWVDADTGEFKANASDYNKEKIELLRGIGYNPKLRGSHEQKFTTRTTELVQYRSQFGHCQVPELYEGVQGLGKWLAYMKKKHADGTLSKSHQTQLETIGVVFEPRPAVATGSAAACNAGGGGGGGGGADGGGRGGTAAADSSGAGTSPTGEDLMKIIEGTLAVGTKALEVATKGVEVGNKAVELGNQNSSQIAELARATKAHQEQINDHDDRITGTEADVAGLKSDQHRLDVRVGSLESDRAKSKKDMDKAKKDIDALKNKVAALTPCKMPPDNVAAANATTAAASGPAGPALGASHQALGLVTPAKPAPAPAPAAAAAVTATAAIGADVGVPSIPSKISKNELESRDDVPVTPAKAAPTGRAVVPSASTTAKKKNKKSSAMVAAATTTFVKLSTSDRKIIRRYTSAHEICEKARNGREFKTFFHKEKDVKELDDIGNVLDKLPAVPEKTILYRATDSTAEQADVWRHAALAKMVYIDPAPVSASKLTFPKQEEKMVNEFIERNTRWTIQSTTGKFIKKYSKKSHEEEVTFRPGSKFRVLSFQDLCPDKPQDWKGKYLIRVEEF